jgi:uncharacterized protein (DUF2237 family)
MNMTLLTRRRVILAKTESVAGTAEALTASDGGFYAIDPIITPEIEVVSREQQGSFSRFRGIAGARGGRCTFALHLYGSGVASNPVPAWAATLLPACRLKRNGSVFSPVTPVSGQSTVTIGVYQDGVLYSLSGAQGNVNFTFTNGQPVRMEFEFLGVWVAPTDETLPTPTYDSELPPRFASATFDIGGATRYASNLTMNTNNTLKLREDATTLSGFRNCVSTDGVIGGSVDPEARTAADWNAWANWLASTTSAMSIQLGAAAGNTIAVAVPKMQFMNVQPGDRDGIHVHQLDWEARRDAHAGDDEATITFS